MATSTPTTSSAKRIEAHTLCAVRVFSGVIEGYTPARRESLVKAILALREQDPGLTISNRYGWHSQRNLHVSTDANFVWLRERLQPFLRSSLESVHEDFRHAKAAITACWANASDRNGWNEPHNHLPSHWSGVFYVSAEGSLNRTDADDRSGCIEFMNPIRMGKVYGSSGSMRLRPRDGLALLFPANVMHFVHPNMTDTTRITIAFNLDIQFRAAA